MSDGRCNISLFRIWCCEKMSSIFHENWRPERCDKQFSLSELLNGTEMACRCFVSIKRQSNNNCWNIDIYSSLTFQRESINGWSIHFKQWTGTFQKNTISAVVHFPGQISVLMMTTRWAWDAVFGVSANWFWSNVTIAMAIESHQAFANDPARSNHWPLLEKPVKKPQKTSNQMTNTWNHHHLVQRKTSPDHPSNYNLITFWFITGCWAPQKQRMLIDKRNNYAARQTKWILIYYDCGQLSKISHSNSNDSQRALSTESVFTGAVVPAAFS